MSRILYLRCEGGLTAGGGLAGPFNAFAVPLPPGAAPMRAGA